MDRIQKALDKAKQRHAEAVTKPEVIAPEKAASDAGSKNKATDPLIAPIDSIEYSQTKVVNVSNEQLDRKRLIAGFYNNSQSAVFRMLRTQVLKKMRGNNWQSLAVTSPTEGEGKSVVAANLAIAIAMELNQTVLLQLN